MLTTIARGFRNLTNFSGRDTPGQFWPYASCVLIGAMAVWIGAFVPMFASTFANVQRFAAEHPDQADMSSGPGEYHVTIHGNHPELMPDFGSLLIVMGVIVAMLVVLLAAAVVRRLHDRGRSGAWGFVPVVFLAIGLVAMSNLMRSIGGEPDMRLFGLLFVNNIVYLATLGALVVQLVQRGRPEPNRYGSAG